jgi:protein TonB
MGLKFMITCATTLAAFVATPVLGKGAEPVQPAGNPGSWITSEDYPPDALRDDRAGTVSFMLTVGSDGLPKECKVTGTSGSAELDDTACRLIMERARFTAARDATGTTVPSVFVSRVRWVLPKTRKPPQPFSVELSFVIEKDGSVSGCTLVDAKGVPAEGMPRLTDPCMVDAYDPLLDDNGKPVARKVTLRTSAVIEPVK